MQKTVAAQATSSAGSLETTTPQAIASTPGTAPVGAPGLEGLAPRLPLGEIHRAHPLLVVAQARQPLEGRGAHELGGVALGELGQEGDVHCQSGLEP